MRFTTRLLFAFPINLPRKHWLVVNVPNGDVTKGTEVAAYVGCGAPEGGVFVVNESVS